MINQRVLTQNIRQAMLGESSQQGVVPAVRKKRLLIPALVVAIAVCIALGAAFLGTPPISTYKPRAQVSSFENDVLVEQKKSLPVPVRLIIERINVDAAIELVGLTEVGAMDTPNETLNAGWLSIGSRPGETGSAVITGHFDGENNVVGVFNKLHLLETGDEISVIDDGEISRTFVVVKSFMYDWNEDVPEVFYRSDGSYLNLITCSGVWSSTEGKFEQRLVVFTTLKDYYE